MIKDEADDEAEMASAGVSKKIYPYVSLGLDLDLEN